MQRVNNFEAVLRGLSFPSKLGGLFIHRGGGKALKTIKDKDCRWLQGNSVKRLQQDSSKDYVSTPGTWTSSRQMRFQDGEEEVAKDPPLAQRLFASDTFQQEESQSPSGVPQVYRPCPGIVGQPQGTA